MPPTRSPKPKVTDEEDILLGQCIEYALLKHLQVMHQRPCRTADGWRTAIQGHKGFPDLVIAGPGGLIIAELKSTTGRFTLEQGTWMNILAGAHIAMGQPDRLIIEEWRPGDWTSGRIRTQIDLIARGTWEPRTAQ